jgi:hypothetical protein
VPGLPGYGRVEGPAGACPGLEGRHLDLEPMPPGQVRHPRVRIDPEHPAADRLELPGDDAGPAAHVEDIRPWDASHDPVDQRAGIARPGPVIAMEP